MNNEQLAKVLLEDVPNKTEGVDDKIGVLATRILMQIQSVPSLLSYLTDFNLQTKDDDKNNVKIQLEFLHLPKEVIPELEKLLSVNFYKKYRLVSYFKKGQAMTGLEISVSASDLPGKKMDYAF
jgi:ribosomal protein S8